MAVSECGGFQFDGQLFERRFEGVRHTRVPQNRPTGCWRQAVVFDFSTPKKELEQLRPLYLGHDYAADRQRGTTTPDVVVPIEVGGE